MDISKRTALGFALVIIVAGLMFAVQFAAEEWLTLNPPYDMTPVLDRGETQNFDKTDFNYISSKYRPYKEPLLIATDEENRDSSWYLMFVKPNVTPPYGGNPLLGRTGYVKVGYDFENLAGTAAFHVLGVFTDNTWKTNRMEGYGSSAFYVTGNATHGDSMDLVETMDKYNNVRVMPAGVRSYDGDAAPYSYYLYFDPARGGLGALHITEDPPAVKGDIYYTDESSGTFYLTHTGGSAVKEMLILVAVDEMQPDDFSLTIDTEFVRTEE